MKLNLPIIHDPDKFKRLVNKPGQIFYWLSCWDGKPVGYEAGTFEKIEQSEIGEKVIISNHMPSFSREHMFLGDLMNRYHGVFLYEDDAMKGYEAALEVWNNNPEMREEEARRSKELREIFSMCDDSLDFPDDDYLLN